MSIVIEFDFFRYRYIMAAIFQLIIPYISMRMDTRGPFMALLACVGIIGESIAFHALYCALLTASRARVRHLRGLQVLARALRGLFLGSRR